MSETPDSEGPSFPTTTPEIGWRQFAKNWFDAANGYVDTIEELLARLATAEADLAAVREIVSDYFEGADGHDSMVELRSRLADVARREQP